MVGRVSGGQRYAAHWTGDNVSSWDHYRMNFPMVINLGLSGYAITGTAPIPLYLCEQHLSAAAPHAPSARAAGLYAASGAARRRHSHVGCMHATLAS